MKSTKKIVIKLLDYVGTFAENKDIAQKIRVEHISPALKQNIRIVLDYSGVSSTTQSFTHALISDLIRKFGDVFFDKVSFKNCSTTVQRVVCIVFDYMQGNL